jgi:hypothetical protein
MNDPSNDSAVWRGRQLIDDIVEAHLASIEALRILKGGRVLHPQLAALLHEHHDYNPTQSDAIKERTRRTIERAQIQSQRDYFYLRTGLLISLCSVIEITVRDVVAENVIQDTDLWKKIIKQLQAESKEYKYFDPKNIVEVSDFLDQNFKRVPKAVYSRGQAHIFRYWLRLVDLEPPDDADDDNTIHQACSARNLMVHGSYRAKRRLKQEPMKLLDNRGNLTIDQKNITKITLGIRRFIEGIGHRDL